MKNKLFKILIVGLVTLNIISGACAVNPSDNKYDSSQNNDCVMVNQCKNLHLGLGDIYTFFGDVQYDSEYFEKVNNFKSYCVPISLVFTTLKAIKTGETKVIENERFISGSDIICWPSKTIYEITISE